VNLIRRDEILGWVFIGGIFGGAFLMMCLAWWWR